MTIQEILTLGSKIFVRTIVKCKTETTDKNKSESYIISKNKKGTVSVHKLQACGHLQNLLSFDKEKRKSIFWYYYTHPIKKNKDQIIGTINFKKEGKKQHKTVNLDGKFAKIHTEP